jgi:hypothetical protein
MILFNDRKFISASFNNEAEIEAVVEFNHEDIFGYDAIYLPKKKIYSKEGAGTIPDGFVIDLARKQWFLIEAELAHHSLWNHIAPQVAKQIIAATQPATRSLLATVVVSLAKEDVDIMQKFENAGVAQIDIRQTLDDILEQKPIIGIPIDAIGPDMNKPAQTLRYEVKLWLIRKLVEFNDPSNILYEVPDDYRPAFDSVKVANTTGIEQVTIDDITLAMLVEHEYLKAGDELTFSYKQRGSDSRQEFRALVSDEGDALIVDGMKFPSTSYAAVHCMQSVGSSRFTINGWYAWRTNEGRLLAQLRDALVATLNLES